MRSVLCLLLLLLLSGGCVHDRSPTTSGAAIAPAQRGPRAPVRLGDTHIKTTEDSLLGTTAYDAVDLFQYGLDRLEEQEASLARVAFARVVAEFPSDPLAAAARYNQAVAAERQGMTVDAAGLYGEYATVAEATDPEEAAGIRLHQGRLLFEAGEFSGAWLPLQKAIASGLLDVASMWEARIHAARVSGKGEQWRVAEGELSAVRREIKRATRTTGERFPWYSGMVWFHAAEMYRDHAESVRLLDVDDLAGARSWLDETAGWFLEARRSYKRVLEHRLVEWSGPAGLALGHINEDFRARMLAADTPSVLDADATDVYLDLLGLQTRSFLDKAVEDYRWLLRDARDLRIEGEWLEKIRGALSRVEDQLAASEPDAEPADALTEAPE